MYWHTSGCTGTEQPSNLLSRPCNRPDSHDACLLNGTLILHRKPYLYCNISQMAGMRAGPQAAPGLVKSRVTRVSSVWGLMRLVSAFHSVPAVLG